MKVRSSLRSLAARPGALGGPRGGRLHVITEREPRFTGRQKG